MEAGIGLADEPIQLSGEGSILSAGHLLQLQTGIPFHLEVDQLLCSGVHLWLVVNSPPYERVHRFGCPSGP